MNNNSVLLFCFIINQDNHLTEIGNKPNSLKEVQGQYMGLLKFTPRGWDTVEKYFKKQSQFEIDALDMTKMLNMLINKEIIKVSLYIG